MTEVSVSDLAGAGLDWAVSVCEKIVVTGHDAQGRLLIASTVKFGPPQVYSPSTDSRTGGEIIVREDILVANQQRPVHMDPEVDLLDVGPLVRAFRLSQGPEAPPDRPMTGPTHLIAAMRYYVASRLGEVITVPDEIAKLLLSSSAKTWGTGA